jgi:hypothetical protein
MREDARSRQLGPHLPLPGCSSSAMKPLGIRKGSAVDRRAGPDSRLWKRAFIHRWAVRACSWPFCAFPEWAGQACPPGLRC